MAWFVGVLDLCFDYTSTPKLHIVHRTSTPSETKILHIHTTSYPNTPITSNQSKTNTIPLQNSNHILYLITPHLFVFWSLCLLYLSPQWHKHKFKFKSMSHVIWSDQWSNKSSVTSEWNILSTGNRLSTQTSIFFVRNSPRYIHIQTDTGITDRARQICKFIPNNIYNVRTGTHVRTTTITNYPQRK